MLIERKGY